MIPLTRSDFLRYIVTETARMSYPGSMSRGSRPIVFKGTKAALERYLLESFPVERVWSEAATIADNYDEWHRVQVYKMAPSLAQYVNTPNDPICVSAKLLNTFMHQMMKYEATRPLFNHLHLPLDRRVFEKLRIAKFSSVDEFNGYFKNSPYTTPYPVHLGIQGSLKRLIAELNARPSSEIKLVSRIQLNFLWI